MQDNLHLSGTCKEMCPRQERQQREKQRRLSRFEMESGTEKWKLPKADPLKTVKEYSRPAAGKVIDVASLRTAQALVDTVDYLLQDVLNHANTDMREIYHFVSDRLRAVKQDIVVQRIGGKPAVEILEKSLRFLIYVKYKLIGETYFDSKLNNDQIKDCSHLLKEIYRSRPDDEFSHRVEFEIYFLLANINSEGSYRDVLSLPQNLRNSQPMKLVVKITCAYREHNYVRFFRLLHHLPFLATCALYEHIGVFRSNALNIMSTAYSSKACSYPIDKLSVLLAYDDKQQVESDCAHHGISIGVKGIQFLKTNFSQLEKPSRHNISQMLVNIKFRGLLSDLLLNL